MPRTAGVVREDRLPEALFLGQVQGTGVSRSHVRQPLQPPNTTHPPPEFAIAAMSFAASSCQVGFCGW